ncbi:MAG: hypothetical protein ACO1OG_08355 [Devosia sp.]
MTLDALVWLVVGLGLGIGLSLMLLIVYSGLERLRLRRRLRRAARLAEFRSGEMEPGATVVAPPAARVLVVEPEPEPEPVMIAEPEVVQPEPVVAATEPEPVIAAAEPERESALDIVAAEPEPEAAPDDQPEPAAEPAEDPVVPEIDMVAVREPPSPPRSRAQSVEDIFAEAFAQDRSAGKPDADKP